MTEAAITIQDGAIVWKIWVVKTRLDDGKPPIMVEERINHGRTYRSSTYMSIEGALEFVNALMTKITEAREG